MLQVAMFLLNKYLRHTYPSLGQPIIVLENGFIDHWKDEIQFSGRSGGEPMIFTLKGGMQCITEAFLDYEVLFLTVRFTVTVQY